MANTYHQLYVQSVFAVKFRAAVIEPSWRKEFFGVVGNLINETGSKTIIVNGVYDHIHCFFGLPPAKSVADVMQHAKANSSLWLNRKGYLDFRFAWQSGYGAFTYSKSQIHRVFKYIQNQEAHHQKQIFREEYIQMLKKFGVDYDEKYIFHDLI